MAICVALSELYLTYNVFFSHTFGFCYPLIKPLCSSKGAEECSSLTILLSSYWLTELRSPDSGRQLDPVGLHISLISLLGTLPKLIKICHFSWQNWQRVAKNEKPPFVAHCLKGTLFGKIQWVSGANSTALSSSSSVCGARQSLPSHEELYEIFRSRESIIKLHFMMYSVQKKNWKIHCTPLLSHTRAFWK